MTSTGRVLARAALAIAVLTAGACQAAAPGTATAPSTAPSAVAPVAVAPEAVHRGLKLLVVLLENHSRAQALQQMPRLGAQAERYGQATQWYAVAHPSLPNYLEITGGSTFGVRDDRPPWRHQLAGRSVFGQLLEAHQDVRAYVEDMPHPCALGDAGRYAVRHNAWTYFSSPLERTGCERYDVPSGTTSSGALHDDVAAGRLPRYAQLIPNVCHDGHDCSLATADSWLAAWLSRIEAGPDFTSGRLAVVITFDEDDHHAGNHVAFVVASDQLHGKVVTSRFTHASLAAAAARLCGLAPLRDGVGSPDVLQQFGLRQVTAAGAS